jgi:hypothetical protein
MLAFFSSSNTSSLKIIITIFTGVFLSILLVRDSNLLLQKTLVAMIGALLTWTLTKIIHNGI